MFMTSTKLHLQPNLTPTPEIIPFFCNHVNGMYYIFLQELVLDDKFPVFMDYSIVRFQREPAFDMIHMRK